MEGDVFTKMPEDVLKKFAEDGVVDAQKELDNRKIAPQNPSTQPMIQKNLTAKNILRIEPVSKNKRTTKNFVTKKAYEEGSTKSGWFSDEDWKNVRRRHRE